MIGREVVAARRVDVQATPCPLDAMQQDGGDVERVELHERLHGHALRRLQDRVVAGHALADVRVAQLFTDLPQLVGAEQQHRLRQDDVDEVERVRNLVADVLDLRVGFVAGGDGVDQRVVLVHVVPSRHLQGDEVVVERSDIAQDFAKVIHLPVVLRDEVEDVRVEGKAHRAGHGGQGNENRDDDNGLASPKTEAGQCVEDSISQIGYSRDDAARG